MHEGAAEIDSGQSPVSVRSAVVGAVAEHAPVLIINGTIKRLYARTNVFDLTAAT